ncbi:MAG: DMT family transporter, partial [Ilumatobacteraceae bacterium]
MSESVTAPSSEASHRFGPAEWGLSAVIAVVWGSSFLWISIAIDHVEAPVVPLGRNFFGALALGLFPMARRGIERSDWWRVGLLSLVWMGIPFLLFPIAEKTVSSGVTGMLNGGLPVVGVVVTAIFVRRAPSARRVAAVCVGFVGIAVISLSSINAKDDGPTADVRGVTLLLISLVCYSSAVNLAAPLRDKYGTLRLMFWTEVAAVAWALPLGVPAMFRSDHTWSAWGSIFVLGAVGTGIAFVVYGVLLGRAGPIRSMIGNFFTPIVSVLLGVSFRDEHISWWAVLG